MQWPTKYVMVRITINPANTQPTIVGTIVSTGSAGLLPGVGEQTSAKHKKEYNKLVVT